MKSTVVDENGDVRCPRCGASNYFHIMWTGKANVVGGLDVGVSALAAAQRLQCQGCGIYLKPGRRPRSAAKPARSAGPVEPRRQDGGNTLGNDRAVRTPRWPRRHPIISAILGGVILVIVLAGIFGNSDSQTQHHTSPVASLIRTPAQHHRSRSAPPGNRQAATTSGRRQVSLKYNDPVATGDGRHPRPESSRAAQLAHARARH